MRLTCTVNGTEQQVDDVWEGESLLYVLRERMGLPGSKNACEQGECGSCTVYLAGLPVCSCLVAAGQAEGRQVGTVEGLADPESLHPVQQAFLDAGAEVEVASIRGTRRIPVTDFYTGVKRNSMAADELIAAVHVVPPSGPQQYSKIGTRNAMVISVAAFGLALHPDRRAVGTGIGSAAPTPRRASAAEEFLAGELTSTGLWESRGELPAATATRFGELVAGAAAQIDDVRGSAGYRVHALSVMARRALTWAWAEYRDSPKEV